MASWSNASTWISYLGGPSEGSSWHSKSVSPFIHILFRHSSSHLMWCACCSLAYLHEAIEPKVVHRDIKSSNILIDDEFNAKVSDFGLAKLLGAGKSHVTTRVMGTFG